MKKVNSCTKDEQLLTSHEIDFTLNALGFNLSSRGYIYYRDLILLSLNFNLDEIRLIDLYSLIAQKYNKPICTIKQNIKNLFLRFDLSYFENNFKDIFGLDFNYLYTSPKNLLILILNTKI